MPGYLYLGLKLVLLHLAGTWGSVQKEKKKEKLRMSVWTCWSRLQFWQRNDVLSMWVASA